jgi:hypothetical protein
MANPSSELLNQILAQATNVRAFGTGMASNVVRLTLTELSKKRQATHIQSVAQGENREYFFYARMSMGSAASVAATQSFCKAVSSELRARWTKSENKLTKLLIPRILLNVDRSDDADDFRRLHQWMKERYRAVPGAEFNDAEFASISIVEGTTVVGLLDHMIAGGRPIPHMHEHLKVLGVLHALDVALGMGDRLQNPNPANITINPTTGQMVLIDMDTFLPPLNCHKLIEDACRFKEKDLTPNKVRNNERWMALEEQWPACPPRLPLQGNYEKKVSAGLELDLKWFLDGLAGRVEVIKTTRTYHGERLPDVMGPMRVSQYIGAFLGQKHEFINAAIETMKAIRDGLNAKQPQFVLSVEDGTCSAARLRERVNRWKF